METRGRIVRAWTSALALLIIASVGLKGAWGQDPYDCISYQGVTIQPGDVINFHQGVFTTATILTYGHTALYLGRDDETREPTFLDFSSKLTKLTEPGPYYGRIMAERRFLSYNAEEGHPSFDVFQLKQRSSLDKKKLMAEAKRVASEREYSLRRPLSESAGEVCSSAAAAVLSKATGRDIIDVITPDDFVSSPLFQRHPALQGKTINIQGARKEAEAREVGPRTEEVFQAYKELADKGQTDLRKLRGDLVEAERVLKRARAGQQARDPKIAAENAQAVQLAERAVADETRAIALAETTLKRWANVRRALERMKAYSSVPAGGITNLRGNVTIKRRDGKQQVSLGTEVLLAGDEVQTNQGQVEIVSRDGSILHFGPDSTFRVPLFPAPPLPEPTTQESPSTWELLKGKLHLGRGSVLDQALGESHSAVSTPAAVLGVRGTEFDLAADENGLALLTPYSGTVELTAKPDGIDQSRLPRWWKIEGAEPVKSPLPEEALMRVSFVRGDVRVRKAADPLPRAVSNGDLVESGTVLTTGAGSLAEVQLAGGLLATLRAGTVLEARLKSDSGQPLYKLSAGTMHAGSAVPAPPGKAPIFVTPNAVVAEEGAEFDLSVDEAGVTTLTLYSGKVTASAQMERLDQTKLDRWWDDIYR